MPRENYQSAHAHGAAAPDRVLRDQSLGLKASFLVLLLVSITLLSGCFHDDDDDGGGNPTPDADPTGYYGSGNASIEVDGDSAVDNVPLEAMIYDNRIIIMSIEEVGVDGPQLLYDGTITNVDGNNFTASLDVYQSGALLYATTINGGMIVGGGGSQITGTFANADGDPLANGSFELLYADNNNLLADLTRIDVVNSGLEWEVADYLICLLCQLAIDSDGTMVFGPTTFQSPYEDCSIQNGSITEIPDSSLYSVNLTLANCSADPAVNGDYSGLAIDRFDIQPGGVLVTSISNGAYAIYGDFSLDGN